MKQHTAFHSEMFWNLHWFTFYDKNMHLCVNRGRLLRRTAAGWGCRGATGAYSKQPDPEKCGAINTFCSAASPALQLSGLPQPLTPTLVSPPPEVVDRLKSFMCSTNAYCKRDSKQTRVMRGSAALYSEIWASSYSHDLGPDKNGFWKEGLD